MGDTISRQARAWLLTWARRSIAEALQGKAHAPPPAEGTPQEVHLRRGCFVTLHTRLGALRGCIGTFSQSEQLWDNVQEMAVAAAFDDPRFDAVTATELDECQIEISVLSPRRRIEDTTEIEVGVHGLWISHLGRSGLLLPQVPVEHEWDRETFLAHTCIKAGLPADAWRGPDVTFEVFTAEVFSERTVA